MALHFRQLDPVRDYPAASSVLCADPLEAKRSAREMELLDERAPRECRLKSWVVEDVGQVIGYLCTMKEVWDVRRGGLMLRLHLMPEASLSALRSCYSFLLREAKAEKASYVTIWTRDDLVRRVQFLEDHGFTLVKRHAVTRLNVKEFIPEPYFPKATVLQKKGVTFCSASQLTRIGVDWKGKLQKAMEIVLREDYGFDGTAKPPFEKFHRRTAESYMEATETSFCAMQGENMIGFTRLFPSEAEPDVWRTGLTGVVPGWRGLKVGTSVKVMTMVEAKRRGIQIVQTDNAEDNPMLHLNLRLGFQRVATLLEHEMVVPRSLPEDLKNV